MLELKLQSLFFVLRIHLFCVSSKAAQWQSICFACRRTWLCSSKAFLDALDGKDPSSGTEEMIPVSVANIQLNGSGAKFSRRHLYVFRGKWHMIQEHFLNITLSK